MRPRGNEGLKGTAKCHVGSEKADIMYGVGMREGFFIKVTFEMGLDELVGF